MRKLWLATAFTLAFSGLAGFACPGGASAHCDTVDGPVVTAARQALESGNLNHVLPWVSKADEAEIRATFEHVRKVRALGAEAKELADRYFFETLVRVHRAGEGAPYTGLKPAGSVENPAVAAADQAFENGSAQALIDLLAHQVREGVGSHFAEALAAQSEEVDNVEARRQGVHAYVEFVHYVEGIYEAASKSGERESHHRIIEEH